MDWSKEPDDEGKYARYLASREWAILRRAVAKRSGGTCERCRKAPATQTHHATYERIYRESLEDLLHVCRPCHLFLSAKSDLDPSIVSVTAERDRLADARRRILDEFDYISFDDIKAGYQALLREGRELESVGLWTSMCAIKAILRILAEAEPDGGWAAELLDSYSMK